MVCGSAPSMGSFAPSQAVVLHTSPETYPLWSPAQALTVPFGIQLRYKYAGTWLALRVLQALHLGCGRCTAPDPATPRHRAPLTPLLCACLSFLRRNHPTVGTFDWGSYCLH